MKLNEWTEVLVTTDNKKDMSYSFTFKNLKGQDVWGSKVRPLAGARNFLAGAGLKKNVDYDFTADVKTGQYCYKFKNNMAYQHYAQKYTNKPKFNGFGYDR